MAPAPELRLDLSHDTFQDMARRPSDPMDLRGVDISSLDARDTPLPSSPSSADKDKERAAERERARSFFGNFGASRSVNLLQIDSGEASKGRSDTLGPQTAIRSSHSPYGRTAPGSTPELSKLLRSADGKNKRSPHLIAGSLIHPSSRRS